MKNKGDKNMTLVEELNNIRQKAELENQTKMKQLEKKIIYNLNETLKKKS